MAISAIQGPEAAHTLNKQPAPGVFTEAGSLYHAAQGDQGPHRFWIMGPRCLEAPTSRPKCQTRQSPLEERPQGLAYRTQ
jgi:hypothetical protein